MKPLEICCLSDLDQFLQRSKTYFVSPTQAFEPKYVPSHKWRTVPSFILYSDAPRLNIRAQAMHNGYRRHYNTLNGTLLPITYR